MQPRVVVLTRDELAQVIADNPFPEETNPKSLHAVFRVEETGPAELDALARALERAAEKGGKDEAEFVGRTLYVRTPDGLGRSALAPLLSRRGGALAADGSGTMRNWATVTKLLALCDA